MRAVVQRVLSAGVSIVERPESAQNPATESGGNAAPTLRDTGKIGPGFLVLVGVGKEDTDEDARNLADKIAHLRVLEDGNGKLNLSLRDTGGSVLVVSNFTLFGDCRKGRRPSFAEAASGAQAESLYRAFGEAIAAFGVPVQYGVFGAEMQVSLVNDGPITLLLDSRRVF